MLPTMHLLDLLTYRAFRAHPLDTRRALAERFDSRPLVLASLGDASVAWAVVRLGRRAAVLDSGDDATQAAPDVLRAATERHRARHGAVALARGFLCERGAYPEAGAAARVRAVCPHPRLRDNAVTFSARRDAVEAAARLASSAGFTTARTACETAALLEWVCREGGDAAWALDGWFLAGRESAVFIPLVAGAWGEPESDPTPSDGFLSAGAALELAAAGRRIGALVVAEAQAPRILEARDRLIPLRAGSALHAWEALAAT